MSIKKTSYPKQDIRVLLLEGVSQTAVETFTAMVSDGMASAVARRQGLGHAAATPLIAAQLFGLLAEHAADGQTEFMLRQGVEMGRPSQIAVQFRRAGGVLTHGGIGGHAVLVGEGVLVTTPAVGSVVAAREPGGRAKIAVSSRDGDVDPVGALEAFEHLV